jgi:hypothetical protein
MADELADTHAAESADIAQSSGGDIGRDTSTPDKPLSIREALNSAVKEVGDRERDETGKFTKQAAAKPAAKDVLPVDGGTGDATVTAPAEQAPQASKPVGPPPGWSAATKEFYNSLPPDHPLRQDVAKREEEISTGFKTYAEKTKQYDALEQVLAPSRSRFQQFGVQNDAEAISRLFQWEASFANPQTQLQAFHNLAHTYGIDLSQFARQSPAPSDGGEAIPDHLKPVLDEVGQLRQTVTGFVNAQQLAEQNRVASEISTFAKDHPHFEKLRVSMGQLMQAGVVAQNDLEAAYQKALRMNDELFEASQREQEEKRKAEFEKTQKETAAKARLAAVSPAPRARQGVPANGADKSAAGVRGSILAAMNEVQERNRA